MVTERIRSELTLEDLVTWQHIYKGTHNIRRLLVFTCLVLKVVLCQARLIFFANSGGEKGHFIQFVLRSKVTM